MIKVFIKEETCYSNKPIKIKVLSWEPQNLNLKITSSFKKNSKLIEKLPEFLKETEIEIKGKFDNEEIKKIEKSISTNKIKKIDVNKVEFEEITSYPEVLKTLKKKVQEEKEKFEEYSKNILKEIESLKEIEENKLLNLKEKKKLIKKEISLLKKKIKNLKKKKHKNEKKNKKIIKKKKKIEQKIEKINLKIDQLEKQVLAYEYKSKAKAKCFSPLDILLVLLSLGFILWFSNPGDCHEKREKAKRKINMLIAEKIILEGKLNQLSPSEPLDKKSLKMIEEFEKEIIKKEEKLIEITAEIESLEKNSTKKVEEVIKSIKNRFDKNIKEIENLKLKIESQKIKFKDGAYVVE